MKIKYLSLLLVLFVGLGACGISYRVTSDYERGTNFTTYNTYQILKHKDGFPYGMNPINRQRIERAVQFEMGTLGMRVDKNPDLIVAYFVKEKTIRQVDHYYRGYYGRWGFPVWVDVTEYKEGTLIIDLIERSSKKVVWHGAAKGRIYDGMDNIEEHINIAVEELFIRFSEDARLRSAFAIAH